MKYPSKNQAGGEYVRSPFCCLNDFAESPAFVVGVIIRMAIMVIDATSNQLFGLFNIIASHYFKGWF
jgi:hypothetical protein